MSDRDKMSGKGKMSSKDKISSKGEISGKNKISSKEKVLNKNDNSSNDSAYERNYKKVSRFVTENNMRLAIFKALYLYIPYLTAVIYFVVIILSVLTADGSYVATVRIILVPMMGFLAVTIMRKFINAPRPYTLYNITPIIHKSKACESFPSRHTFSITIIAMAILYYNLPLGAVMLVLAVVLGITRVIAGVHFVKDVTAAWTIAVVWGIVGLWII